MIILFAQAALLKQARLVKVLPFEFYYSITGQLNDRVSH